MTRVLAAARDLIATGRPGAMATALSGPDLGGAGLFDFEGRLIAGDLPPAAVGAAVTDVLTSRVPLVVEEAGWSWFVEPVLPPPRMIVLGAVAVADALVPVAVAAGFAVHVIDRREWLATEARYPVASSVICSVPIDALRSVGMDASTSVVSFLHEARLEDPVLIEALAGPAGYVGSMGSRRSTEAKRKRLSEAGVADTDLARLAAPIGLSIGARTPQEIAVAVLAEVVAVGRAVEKGPP